MVNLPRPDYYSAEDLAECWDISVSMVKRYTHTGQLRLRKLYYYDDLEGTISSWLPDIREKVDEDAYRSQGWYGEGLYYKLEDVESFEKASDQEPNVMRQGELLPSERKSLLKMVYVMAVKGYAYDSTQKKSKIPSEIVADAAECDLGIDEGTVRKWLKASADIKENLSKL